ncbi:MAG: response regulator [Thermoplasmata archaeon]|nr:response regulator [Thermoplasmata archaeon]
MKKTMLVVEDEEPIQDLIREYLNPLNMEIYFASTGEAGVELYKKLLKNGKRPDIVIMDLRLPGIDGAEATKRIMKIDKDARIYAFTAWFKTKLAQNAIKAGVKAVIGRYIGFDGFRDIVKNIFAGKVPPKNI